MKILMKCNEAIAEAAIRAGCTFYAGYPITPQSELTHYMARHLPENGGVFVQAESEVAAINMVLGAGIAGARAMTSSSSPGISLMQEGISYMAGCEVSGVIINMVRGGPGLGSIGGSQSDYFQATKGGGHGDYRMFVLAPSGTQEVVDLTMKAFDLADNYRTPVMILGDGTTGQVMESITFKEVNKDNNCVKKDWILDGCRNREPRFIKSLYLDPGKLEEHNYHLLEKYKRMEKEVIWEEFNTDNADVLIVAYGLFARVCKRAIIDAKTFGINAGLIRPITLWPFPYDILKKYTKKTRAILVAEMSLGQMIEDVRLAVCNDVDIYTHFRPASNPTPNEVVEKLRMICEKYTANQKV